MTYETLNRHVIKMEYAVRGKIPQEARRIEKAIKKAREREREGGGMGGRERERERENREHLAINF